jgi:hypothetical protein
VACPPAASGSSARRLWPAARISVLKWSRPMRAVTYVSFSDALDMFSAFQVLEHGG